MKRPNKIIVGFFDRLSGKHILTWTASYNPEDALHCHYSRQVRAFQKINSKNGRLPNIAIKLSGRYMSDRDMFKLTP